MAVLRAAVIGLRMGHAQALAAIPEVELAAVCDVDAERGRQVAQELGVEQHCTDYRALVEADGVDIVTVASPDNFHCAMTCELLASGKHVLCEKPMAPTLAESRQMALAARQAGRKLMIGQSYRFDSRYRALHDLVGSGEIGELYYVEADYWNNLQGVGGVGNWRNDPRIRHPYVGGCHAMDLLRWIAGEPVVEVMAYANHRAFLEQPTDDFILGNARFASGLLGRAIVSSGCQRPFRTSLNVYGTQGSIEDWQLSHHKGEDFGPISMPTGAPTPILAEQRAFVESVLEDTQPEVSAEDGYGTMAACFAVIESAQTGLPVPVNEAI